MERTYEILSPGVEDRCNQVSDDLECEADALSVGKVLFNSARGS